MPRRILLLDPGKPKYSQHLFTGYGTTVALLRLHTLTLMDTHRIWSLW